MAENESTSKKSDALDTGHSRALHIVVASLASARDLGVEALRDPAWLRYMPVPALLAGGLSISLTSTIAVAKVADSMLSRQTRAFDDRVMKLARGARRSDKKLVDPIMTLLSAAGEPWTLYPVTGLVALKYLTEERSTPTDAAALALGLVGSAGINGLLKHIVRRPRPRFKLPIARSGSSGSSFPSSHATMSLATYGMIARILARRQHGGKGESRGEKAERVTRARAAAKRIKVAALLLCGLIGWSRLYQGVHNPSDVLGGWLAGGIWLLTCNLAATSMAAKRSQENPSSR